MPMLENQVDLYYTEAGEGETILFCHGAASNAATWFNQVGAFSKNYHCVAYDCRGFGRSVCTEEEFDGGSEFAADAIALLDHLDVESAFFVCQSMGGWTGVQAALDFPDRVKKLVLAGTIGGIALASGIESFRSYRKQNTGIVASIAAGGFLEKNPAGAFLYAQIREFNQPPGGRGRARLPNGAIHGARFDDVFDEAKLVPIERAQTIEKPILIISGTYDLVWPPTVIKELAELLPTAEWFEVDAGHSPHFEEPGVFNRALGEFLIR